MEETQVRSLSQEDPREKEMVIHFYILAWRIPWTEEFHSPWVSNCVTQLRDFHYQFILNRL